MPGHAAVSAAGRCVGSLAPPALGGGQMSDEVQALTARRRLRQVARSPFLSCTADTTRASRCPGRLSKGGGGGGSTSMPTAAGTAPLFAVRSGKGPGLLAACCIGCHPPIMAACTRIMLLPNHSACLSQTATLL